MKINYVTEETDERLSKYDLEGTQAEVIQRINDAFTEASTLYLSIEDVTLYLDWRPHQYDEGDDLYIYARRPENDAEKAKRKAVAKEQKTAVEARERKLLADLQAKYATK